MAYVQKSCKIVRDDGDLKILWFGAQFVDVPIPASITHVELELWDDRFNDVEVIQSETNDAIDDMLSNVGLDPSDSSKDNISPNIEYEGHKMYKSTLVSQMNGNPFLSKDKLTKVNNLLYFNNNEDYPRLHILVALVVGFGL